MTILNFYLAPFLTSIILMLWISLKVLVFHKVERGNRVFLYQTNLLMLSALKNELIRLNVNIRYNTLVKSIIKKDNKFFGIRVNQEIDILEADAILIATGGISYPTTGSTGDGYRFAKEMGHSITPLYPSLVPLHVKEDFVKELMGLSLKNISITIKWNEKEIYKDFGELMFTHFGVSGPVILSASSYITKKFNDLDQLSLYVDLKPALTEQQLDQRILRDFEKFKNKEFKNSLSLLLPKKLIDVIIRLSLIPPDKKVNSITKKERHRLLKLIKSMHFKLTKTSGYNQAVITQGGIHLKDINPRSMESKLFKNVYFIGEVLDLDALTGGYNLQIAWSTAYLAGNNIR